MRVIFLSAFLGASQKKGNHLVNGGEGPRRSALGESGVEFQAAIQMAPNIAQGEDHLDDPNRLAIERHIDPRQQMAGRAVGLQNNRSLGDTLATKEERFLFRLLAGNSAAEVVAGHGQSPGGLPVFGVRLVERFVALIGERGLRWIGPFQVGLVGFHETRRRFPIRLGQSSPGQ